VVFTVKVLSAWAAPERAIAAARINARVTNNKMRFIGATLSLRARGSASPPFDSPATSSQS
jgi:hypothetical protein